MAAPPDESKRRSDARIGHVLLMYFGASRNGIVDSSDAKQHVRQLIDEEFASNYTFVRRFPSTEIWKTLAYLDSLDENERDTLFDLWAGQGTAMLTSVEYEGQMEIVEHPIYQRFRYGKTSSNPVMSTLRYFRDEYEAHIKEKRCSAFSCKALTSYYVDPDKCKACMICLKQCPMEAISGGKNQIHVIDQEKCTRCGTCYEVCPSRFDAVRRISGDPVPSPIPEDSRIIVRESKGQ